MIFFALTIYAAAFWWFVTYLLARRRRRQRAREAARAVVEFEQTAWFLAAAEARRRGRDTALRHIGRDPEVWTPAEREALGINDTIRFIAETDKILKGD